MSLATLVLARFRDDGAFNMASSLSYTTLLSLVPLLAIGLAVLAAFPVFDGMRDTLQATIFRYVVPDVGEQVQHYVAAFVRNAGKLTAAGVAGLTVSAIMVLVTIESSLNQIFRVVTPRSPISRLAVYWTALTLGPLLIGIAFSLWAWLAAAGDFAAHAGLSGLLRTSTAVAPVLLMAAAFTLLFRLVPNRRVPVRDAVIGGVAAALAFALLRSVFGLYVANARTYQSIYGAVATVPIFLFWMYLSWMVVLFGAELAAALPEWRLARGRAPAAEPERRLALALAVLDTLRRSARLSGKGCTRQELLSTSAEGEAELLLVLDRLCSAELAVRSAAGRLLLGRDLASVPLSELVKVLGLGLSAPPSRDGPGMRVATPRLAAVASAEAAAFDIALSAVLDDTAEPFMHAEIP